MIGLGSLRVMRNWTAPLMFALMFVLALGSLSVPSYGAEDEAALSQESAALLQGVIAGEHRTDKDKARDLARHPFETLSFFGVEAHMTVVEVWPGGGWYSEILAPYLAQGNGTFYAAHWDTNGASERFLSMIQSYEKHFSNKETYGSFVISALGPNSEGIAPDGTVDAVVTFRNLHNWIPRGVTEKYFADIYKALKPGGIFGVIDHRGKADKPQDSKASTGYVKEDYAITLAQEAGFLLVARSEVNANSKDTADHPFGVWTLPPTSARARFGQKADETFDGAPYLAIGESDRFTLKFIKPYETE